MVHTTLNFNRLVSFMGLFYLQYLTKRTLRSSSCACKLREYYLLKLTWLAAPLTCKSIVVVTPALRYLLLNYCRILNI